MPNGQVIQHPHWPPGVGPNRPVHPGPAPINPPWWGQHPDWCDCGCQDQRPCPPDWSQDAIRCWNEMQAFRNMVAEIVQGELARLPSGITGVIDGSNAKPGQVGEFITGSGTLAYAATATTSGSISTLVVPPGDWDIYGWMSSSSYVNGVSFAVSPVPAGLSNPMTIVFGVANPPTGVENMIVFATPARGSFAVPTLLAFSGTIFQPATGGTAGNARIVLEARRMR